MRVLEVVLSAMLLSACGTNGAAPPAHEPEAQDERALCERLAAGDRSVADRLARIGGSDTRDDVAAFYCDRTYGIRAPWWVSAEDQQAQLRACRELDAADVSVRARAADQLAPDAEGGTEQRLEAAAAWCHLTYDLRPSWSR